MYKVIFTLRLQYAAYSRKLLKIIKFLTLLWIDQISFSPDNSTAAPTLKCQQETQWLAATQAD